MSFVFYILNWALFIKEGLEQIRGPNGRILLPSNIILGAQKVCHNLVGPEKKSGSIYSVYHCGSNR